MRLLKLFILSILLFCGIEGYSQSNPSYNSIYVAQYIKLGTKKITKITTSLTDSTSTLAVPVMSTVGSWLSLVKTQLITIINTADTIRLDVKSMKGDGTLSSPLTAIRKSIVVSADTYTIADSVGVVFGNRVGGTMAFTLPPADVSHLDIEITVKNLSTTNNITMTGVDAGDFNVIGIREAATFKCIDVGGYKWYVIQKW